jgi:hypothetical protein
MFFEGLKFGMGFLIGMSGTVAIVMALVAQAELRCAEIQLKPIDEP